MAAMTFAVSSPCSGDNHFTVTATVGGKPYPLPLAKGELLDPVSDDEACRAILTLLRWMGPQLADRSAANIKTRLEAKTLDLTP